MIGGGIKLAKGVSLGYYYSQGEASISVRQAARGNGGSGQGVDRR